ncbi:MAG: DNA mismatch repair endonuclease MutL, partial [Chloroflexi bacterium]|nr:DNA mismatch repair endonuclease MutL [Chloroflexota bacterium]
MPIQILSPLVISKIAAGEVVERPASVVKELLENSLDAGATQVSIEVGGGGIQLIRVADNGSGIHAGEVELAFERHATSKITSEGDIESISTLGFRGEALPTIASVAEVSLVTRHRDEDIGTMVKIENGTTVSKSKQGSAQGTIITVRNLFQNVPARLKFLKSVSTEAGHINSLVTQYALAFPEVKFTLVVNGRTVLRTSGNGNLRDALVEAYGVETAQAMLEIEPKENAEEGLPRVTGFVGPASVARSSRDYLSFFINRRWVQNRALTFAVEQAYQGMLMVGKHPIVVLNIAVPPPEIDVNAHPTKREIRFRHEGEVFLAVQRAVRETLVGLSPVPHMKVPSSRPLTPDPRSLSFFAPPRESTLPASQSASPQGRPDEPALPAAQLPILRVIGQFQSTYILAEGPDGMYLIDQHAAHERILFEKIQEQQARQAPEVQGLLEPMPIEVAARQAELVRTNAEALAATGFSLEPFGERAYLLRAVPSVIKRSEIVLALMEIIDSLGESEKGRRQERIAQSLACHGAV